jgi:hypothetical protein
LLLPIRRKITLGIVAAGRILVNKSMFIDFANLQRMAQQSAAVTQPCSCNDAQALAWQQIPLTLELDQFEEVGTLVQDPYGEPAFKEYHPAGTRLQSDDAPIRYCAAQNAAAFICATRKAAATSPKCGCARCVRSCWSTRRCRKRFANAGHGRRQLGYDAGFSAFLAVSCPLRVTNAIPAAAAPRKRG